MSAKILQFTVPKGAARARKTRGEIHHDGERGIYRTPVVLSGSDRKMVLVYARASNGEQIGSIRVAENNDTGLTAAIHALQSHLDISDPIGPRLLKGAGGNY